jgi:hypothetical protein
LQAHAIVLQDRDANAQFEHEHFDLIVTWRGQLTRQGLGQGKRLDTDKHSEKKSDNKDDNLS